MPSVQTRRKRKLGRFLAELRGHAGLKPEAVAKLLRKTPSTVSRIENGHSLCDYSALTAMLGFYRANAEQRRLAEDLWEEAKQEAPPLEHSTAMPPRYRAFVKAWSEAASARSLYLIVLPGPLQTSDYRAAMYRAAGRFIASPIDAERDAASMEHRKKRLNGPNALQFTALLDEAVIRRTIGGPAVMAEQLRYLLALAERPNVTIQAIPFATGAYGLMTGAVTILGFDDPDDEADAVYLEYPDGGEWVEKPDDVTKFDEMFEHSRSLALSVEETAALIDNRAKRLEQGR
ncbi:helix-turn-helix domain-containing protein [Actinokineospora enzanensis]|uniref:helix-turn-helix domain-containing protein n=1 Tax=Actinokineospora enzanensis TaxID=155975 RepID=UPI0003A41871|nr:helix-turn-helix transcriptional regulator [Actinokineospora enzanensis]